MSAFGGMCRVRGRVRRGGDRGRRADRAVLPRRVARRRGVPDRGSGADDARERRGIGAAKCLRSSCACLSGSSTSTTSSPISTTRLASRAPRSRSRRGARSPPHGRADPSSSTTRIGASAPPNQSRSRASSPPTSAHAIPSTGHTVVGAGGAGMELRGNVPRDEEREPEVLATLLDPGAAPADLGAVRPRPRAGLDLEPEPGRGRVDVVVREAHGEPAVAVRGQLHERPSRAPSSIRPPPRRRPSSST